MQNSRTKSKCRSCKQRESGAGDRDCNGYAINETPTICHYNNLANRLIKDRRMSKKEDYNGYFQMERVKYQMKYKSEEVEEITS